MANQLRDAVDQAAAWQRIPQEMPPLLMWTQILVARLPKITAALLELDDRRAGSGAAVPRAAPLPRESGEGA